MDGDAGVVRSALARLADGPWPDVATASLGDIGEAEHLDRVYVFQNLRGPDGRLWMDLVVEWDAPGVRQIFDSPGDHLHPYYPDFVSWLEQLGGGQQVAQPVASLPAEQQLVLAAEGTHALVETPVTVDGEWWGFVGLDAVSPERAFSDDDLALATRVASAVASAVSSARAVEDKRFLDDRFRAMVEQGPAVSYIDAVDEDASTIYISPQIEAMVGYTPEEWIATSDLWPRLLHPDDRAHAVAENARHNETGEPYSVEYRLFTKDGRVVWVHDEGRMIRDERGMPRYSHGVLLDITNRRRTEEQTAAGAYHDELTGLPSRAMFEELLELSVTRARSNGTAVAVVLVDLDDFRLINDSLGHRAGDDILGAFANRLRDATRETDFVARRGADRFLVLLSDLDLEEGRVGSASVRAEWVARRIGESLTAPFEAGGTEVYVAASIGVSLFPRDAADPSDLLRGAEAAMYEAKKTGNAGFVMAAGSAEDSSARLAFVTRLRKAVEGQRWTLYYQPVIELSTDSMVGVEALIRWIEPDGTMVPPIEFIPLAEEMGLIEQIGDWVVREIAYQVQAWRELDMDLEVGFNLSPRQFWQPDLAERIVRAFRDAGVAPQRVLVEVTESSAMMDPDRAQQILVELRDAGFAVAIDDFGTGYSSLSRLREMPVRVLKIDRSFVSNVDTDPQSASIVGAFLTLAQGLGMTTLAEGIETEGELRFLREHGCELGQGFYFSKPVPPEEIIAYAFGGIPVAAGQGRI